MQMLKNIKEKANLFNKYFSSQCNPLANGSKIPENHIYITETGLSSCDIEDEVMCKIIKALGISGAHGRDGVSVWVLKLCEGNIVKPLSIMFKNCGLEKIFPNF